MTHWHIRSGCAFNLLFGLSAWQTVTTQLFVQWTRMCNSCFNVPLVTKMATYFWSGQRVICYIQGGSWKGCICTLHTRDPKFCSAWSNGSGHWEQMLLCTVLNLSSEIMSAFFSCHAQYASMPLFPDKWSIAKNYPYSSSGLKGHLFYTSLNPQINFQNFIIPCSKSIIDTWNAIIEWCINDGSPYTHSIRNCNIWPGIRHYYIILSWS